MRSAGPLLILTAGVMLAGLFGARNGADFAAHRADQAAGIASPLPDPGQRLRGWLHVGGIGWGAGIGLIVLGAGLARRRQAGEASGEGAHDATHDMGEGLKELLGRTDVIAKQIAELPMDEDAPEAREALDAISFEVITPLVDARGRFIARHGLAVFTEYFSPFSAGERQLARAWSALTDGHAAVARASLANARRSFTQALDAWEKAEAT